MQLTDIAAIKDLCARHGFALSKGFGQNFIVNAGICPKIVQAAGIDTTYGVLEIGPGIGVLTRELVARAAKVVAIEIDDRLLPVLAETLADCKHVKIVQGDVLKTDLAALIAREFAGLKVAVCANLPYYITSPIIMKLLEERLPIEHLTVMVQKEAADRLSAQPGTRAAGAITYAVHYYAQPRTLFTVQPGSFYPPPKVTSAVIQLNVHKTPPVVPDSEAQMFRTIRAAFSQRRKTAVNAISAGLSLPKEQVVGALAQAGLPAAARPEQLTLLQYAGLSNALSAQKSTESSKARGDTASGGTTR
ncbi:MAG: 16S rRNA (adenine(1518)-N(6)/adenine(1519)-N(6))-dimethyltransferase RsmA [Ruthenibacterium sp.]